MGGNDNDLVARKLADQVAHCDALLRVKPRRRLVEHQNVRIVQNCLREEQTLAHTAGIAAQPFAAHIAQLHLFQQLVDPLRGKALVHPTQ